VRGFKLRLRIRLWGEDWALAFIFLLFGTRRLGIYLSAQLSTNNL